MRNPFRRIRDFFRKPAMIGTPPSKRSMWRDPNAHARDFAERYAEPMNYHVENRMMELGIDPAQIGVGDPDRGVRHAAFMPHEWDGGAIRRMDGSTSIAGYLTPICSSGWARKPPMS
jgi:hypothetical protein